ncbi:hypothetical protein ACGFZQ_36575 [Streptomyces sp. NPDC048254]|uniref:hypothetical protein n=1 Tax=Streptomyces sp. NPDC048254 TaxID=3365525 RepID=UPI00371DD836
MALAHDHRTFGSSGGTPRQDVDPWRQIADWRRAGRTLLALLEEFATAGTAAVDWFARHLSS